MKKYLLIGFMWCTSCGSEPKPKFTPPEGDIPLSEDVSQQPRYALVIGNGDYRDLGILANPANDAALVSQSLEAVGFQVTTLTNLNRTELTNAVMAFSRQLKAQPKSVGLFYYAGHGLEVGEHNYLLPVDLSVTATDQAELNANLSADAYPLSTLVKLLSNAGNLLNLVYLDACRNNPFRGRSIGGRSALSNQGFRAVNVDTSDIYIGYSTALGAIAQDYIVETDKNSPFATAFATAIQRPNQSFEDAYKTIIGSVRQKTSNTQMPWSNGSVRKKFVFFPTQQKTDAPPAAAKVDNAPIAAPPAAAPAPAAPARQVFEPEMVSVQGGTFKMGSNDSNAESDEKPVHTVTVGNFSIGKYELTVGEFRIFISETSYKTDAEKEGYSYAYENGSWNKKQGVTWKCDIAGNVRPSNEENHPVIHVSWNDAVAYCKWLSQKTGKRYSLPTEAQWEYAARGGNSSKGYTYSGSNDVNAVAWYGSNSGNKTHPVGGKSANELGIYDMSGNIWEWCSDWYGTYSSAAVTNPTGAATGVYRVRRGGSWGNTASLVRVPYRDDLTPANRLNDWGFRVVLLPS